MRRFLVLLLLSAVVFLARPPALAGACSCASFTPTEAAERADVVFSGTWVADEHVFPEDDLDDAVDELIHTFAVDRVYKGEVPEEVEVLSHRYSASCGAQFDQGRYLIFAHHDEHSGDLSTSLCDGNEMLEDGAEVPAELGEGRAVAGAAIPAEEGGSTDGTDGTDGSGEGDGPTTEAQEATEPITPVGSTADDDVSTGDLLAALGAVGLGLGVVAAAIAWAVTRRRARA